MRVSRDDFEKAVEQALQEIPATFAPHLANVMVEIEDLPDEKTCAAVGLSDRRSLLGLYHGLPLTSRSVEHSGRLPDRITIYQANIQRLCRTRPQLVAQIRKTVLHEIGHHFGLNEDDLDELGYG